MNLAAIATVFWRRFGTPRVELMGCPIGATFKLATPNQEIAMSVSARLSRSIESSATKEATISSIGW